MNVQALCFDVFGTVVDWRNSIVNEMKQLVPTHDADWARFADDWRGLYQPAMEAVRSGNRGFVRLDVLHRENLNSLIERYSLQDLGESQLEHINRIWHRLQPWPDVVAGLTRLKSRYTLVTLSNGNVALISNMAKNAGLPWDLVLGAEVSRHYKPQPEAYLSTIEMLDLRAEQCVMVAAHNGDLFAAAKQGMRTAFVMRPTEHGFDQTTDLRPGAQYDWVANDFVDLAEQLGC